MALVHSTFSGSSTFSDALPFSLAFHTPSIQRSCFGRELRWIMSAFSLSSSTPRTYHCMVQMLNEMMGKQGKV
jgi:hypothetical protein